MTLVELKYPYIWEERCPHLEERALFVPDFYQGHETFAMPTWADIFGNQLPLVVEYCSGNGEWIVQKAKNHPELNWIAVEWDFHRAKQIFKRMQTQGLTNLFIVIGEAITFSRYYLKANSIKDIYINFPDPWPKERHAKHRLVQRPLVEEALRTLIPGGGVTMVTDAVLYAEQMVSVFRENLSFCPYFESPYFTTYWENYGRSYFGTLWSKKGLNIHYIKFDKHADH